MIDWIFGFIGGIFATILGFVLLMCWELHKDKKMENKGNEIIDADNSTSIYTKIVIC